MLPFFARALADVLRLSWQAAILIGLVLLVQRLARRRLPASWRYNLWLVVVLRLLLPVSPQSAWSLFNVAQVPFRILPAPQAVTLPAPQPGVMPANTGASAPSIATVPLPATAGRPPADASPQNIHLVPQPPLIFPEVVAGQTYDYEEVMAWAVLDVFANVIVSIWLAGVVLLLIHIGWTTARSLRQVRHANRIDDPEINALFAGCRRELNVSVLVALRETPLVKSPALFGVFRPCLLLPPGLLRHFAPAELRYVFLHELAHVKRRDVAMNWLLTLLQVVHWFNPVIWFGFARLRADRELACDALAMSCSGEEEARTYGLTIVKLLESFSRAAGSPGLVGILENRGQMARRLRLIASFRRNRRWSWVAIVLLAALAVTGLTNAVRSTGAETPASPGPPPSPNPALGPPLRLIVVDAQTGQPIPDAGVVWGYGRGVSFPGGPTLLHTNKDGSVVLPGTLPGGQGAGVVAAGYAPRAVQWLALDGVAPKVPPEYTLKLERGVSIGGVLRDAATRPLANVHVALRGFSDLHGEENKPIQVRQEYEFYEPTISPGPVTDAAGRWTCAHFPTDIEVLELDCTAEDGSFARFHTPLPAWVYSAGRGEVIDLDAAKRGDLVCVFKRGIDVHGVVVDSESHALAGVKIVETDRRHPGQPVSTLTSGPDGRFTLLDRDPHQVQLTLTGSGLAVNATIVTITPNMPELSIAMRPPAPLRVRTVDQAGHAVAGIKVQPSEPALDWTGTTDADGRVAWLDAPYAPGVYSVYAEGYGSRLMHLSPNGSEQTVVVRKGDPPGTLLTIKAADENGRPLDDFSVVALCQTPGGIMDEFNRPEKLGEGRAGLATVLVPQELTNTQDFRLKIESPGHEAFFSQPMSGSIDQAMTIVLQKSSALTLTLPDGKPAVHATAAVWDKTNSQSSMELMFLSPGQPTIQSEDAVRLHADAAGSIQLPAGVPPDSSVAVVDEKGYLFETIEALRRTAHVQLQPWGELEGTMTLNGHPLADQRLELRNLSFAQLRLQYFITTDRNGHFACTRIPAGRFIVYATQPSSYAWPESHPREVEVTAGQTTHFAYDTTGRTLSGQIQITPADAQIDWKKDVQSCLLHRQQSPVPQTLGDRPESTDYMRDGDLRQANKQYFAAHQFGWGTSETYGLQFDANGGFHSEGVPPGTYELKLDLADTGGSNEQVKWKQLGSLTRTVTIPAAPVEGAGQTCDLGTIEVPVRSDLIPKRPLVTFSAQTLDGQPVRLSDYQGKNVLLAFWACWAPPPAEQLAAWKRVAEAHGADPHLVMLGVSLDNDAAATRQFVEANSLPGIQTRLDGPARASVTEALSINDLPAFLLIGPDGRLLARDLSGPRVSAAVDAALSTAPLSP